MTLYVIKYLAQSVFGNYGHCSILGRVGCLTMLLPMVVFRTTYQSLCILLKMKSAVFWIFLVLNSTMVCIGYFCPQIRNFADKLSLMENGK